MPQAQPLPRWMLVAAPLVAVGALLATFVVGGDDGDDPSPVPAYAAEVDAVFDDVREPLLDLADVSGRWVDGEADDAALAAALDDAEAVLPAAADDLAALDAPDETAPAPAFYAACVDLYLQAVAAHREALAATGDARTEANRLARRVRTLADRAYDRARAIVDPADPDPEGVRVVRSDPVPDWDAEGLAAGPPAMGAGEAFDDQARGLAAAGDEPGYRRGLQLLVLADAERARVLGLGDVAEALERVASSMTG